MVRCLIVDCRGFIRSHLFENLLSNSRVGIGLKGE